MQYSSNALVVCKRLIKNMTVQYFTPVVIQVVKHNKKQKIKNLILCFLSSAVNALLHVFALPKSDYVINPTQVITLVILK